MHLGNWLNSLQGKLIRPRRRPQQRGVASMEVVEQRLVQSANPLIGLVTFDQTPAPTQTLKAGVSFTEGPSPVQKGVDQIDLGGKLGAIANAVDGILSLFGGGSDSGLPDPNKPQNVTGTSKSDTIITGVKNDTVKAGAGNDTVYTSKGADDVDLGDGHDTAHTGAGNDKAKGGRGNDALHTGNNDDTLDGGQGDDLLDGGEGFDEYQFRDNSGRDVLRDPSTDGKVFFLEAKLSDVSVRQDGHNLEISVYKAGVLQSVVQFRDYFAHPDRSGWKLGVQDGEEHIDCLARGEALDLAELIVRNYSNADRHIPPAGFEEVFPIDDSASGLQSMLYRELGGGNEAILAIRGTELPNLGTIESAVNRALSNALSDVSPLVAALTSGNPQTVLSEIEKAATALGRDVQELSNTIYLELKTSLKDFASDLQFGRNQGEYLAQQIDHYLATHKDVTKLTITAHSLGYLDAQWLVGSLGTKYFDKVDFLVVGFGGPGAAHVIPGFAHKLPNNVRLINFVNQYDPIYRLGVHHHQTEFRQVPGEGAPPKGLGFIPSHLAESTVNYLKEHDCVLPPALTIEQLQELDRDYESPLPVWLINMSRVPATQFQLQAKETVHRFDMGPAGGHVQPGTTSVTPEMQYSTERGYGFKGSVQGIDRGRADDLQRDFVSAPQIEFVADVAAGAYDVILTIGDAGEVRQEVQIGINGFYQESITTYAGQFVQRTYRVNAHDGQLQVSLTDVSGKPSNAVLNGVQIDRVDPRAEISPIIEQTTNPSVVVLTHGYTKPDWLFAVEHIALVVKEVVDVVIELTQFVGSIAAQQYWLAIKEAGDVLKQVSELKARIEANPKTHVSDWVFQAARDLSAMVRRQGLGSLDPNVIPINLPDISRAKNADLLGKWKGSRDFLAVDWTDESNNGLGLFNYDEKEHRQAVDQASTAIVRMIEARIRKELEKNPNMKLDVLFVGYGFGGAVTRDAVTKLTASPLSSKTDFVKVVMLDPLAVKPDGDKSEKAKTSDKFFWFHPEGRSTAIVDSVFNYYQDTGFAPGNFLENRVTGFQPLDGEDGGGAYGFTNGQGRVYDVTSGLETLRFRHHHEETGKLLEGELRDILFAKDGKWIVSVGEDGIIDVRSAVTGDQWISISGQRAKIRDAALMPDSKSLLTVASDKTLQLTSLEDGRILAVGLHKGATRVAVSSDGLTIATAGTDDEIRIWHVETTNGKTNLRHVQSLRGHDKKLNSLAFDATTGALFVGGNERQLQAWAANNGVFAETPTFSVTLGAAINRIVASNDTVFAASGNEVSMWKWQNNQLVSVGLLQDHIKTVRGLSISGDGTRLATGGDDRTIFVYDLSNMHKVNVLNKAMLPVRNLALNHDGTAAAAVYIDVKGGPVKDINLTDAINDRLGWWDKHGPWGDTHRHEMIPDMYLEQVVGKNGEDFFAKRDNPHALRPTDIDFSHTWRQDLSHDEAGHIDAAITGLYDITITPPAPDLVVSRPQALDLSSIFQDQDNAGLKYSVTSSNAKAIAVNFYDDGTGLKLVVTPIDPGVSTITLQATDGDHTQTVTFTVTADDDESRQKLNTLKQAANRLSDEIQDARRDMDHARDVLKLAETLAKEADKSFRKTDKNSGKIERQVASLESKLAANQRKIAEINGAIDAGRSRLSNDQPLAAAQANADAKQEASRAAWQRYDDLVSSTRSKYQQYAHASKANKPALKAEWQTLKAQRDQAKSEWKHAKSEKDHSAKELKCEQRRHDQLPDQIAAWEKQLRNLREKESDLVSKIGSLNQKLDGEGTSKNSAAGKLEAAIAKRAAAMDAVARIQQFAIDADVRLNELFTGAHDLRESKLLEKIGLDKFEKNRLLDLKRELNHMKSEVHTPTRLLAKADAAIARAEQSRTNLTGGS